MFPARSALMSHTSLILILGLLAFITVRPSMPNVAGYFWPVVSPGEIISLEDAGDGWTLVELRFEKMLDCDLTEVQWWQGEPERSALIPIRFLKPPRAVAPGEYTVSNILVQMPPSMVRRSTATVTHQCDGWPWPTISVLLAPEVTNGAR